MVVLLIFAFLSGLVTILAPCIWPLLPIILSSSVASRSHHRPLGITLGIMLSFAVFTLTISTLVRLFHFDPNILRLFAVLVIGFLGLTMIIPALSQVIELLTSRITGLVGRKGQPQGNGFSAGFVTGLSLGIVWSPCAGPILAAIATLSATGQISTTLILITIAYVLGVGVPLFFFAYGGQQLVMRSRGISAYTGRIQQIFGVLMLLTALAIYTNYDKYLQAQLLNALPGFSSTLTNFENTSAVKQQLDVLRGNTGSVDFSESELLNAHFPAANFTGVTRWLNLPEGKQSLSLNDLKGKVVLVDFWTYTCINCIRTLPFVTSWYEKYKDQGFTVIGVHTPEFEFEKDTTNVQKAIKMYGIDYPVVQDNNYAIWNAYSNQYWPAEYLIDAEGNVRRVHFGEGEYDKTEQAIQLLLQEAGKKVQSQLTALPDQTPQTQLSPETYVGSKRMQFYYPSKSTGNGTRSFTLAETPPENSFSLGGQWTVSDEYASAGKNANLTYTFFASKVFVILRPMSMPQAKVRVFLDGKPIDAPRAGSDVVNGSVTVDTDRLYNIVDLHGQLETHTVRLEFETPGTAVFTFTFG